MDIKLVSKVAAIALYAATALWWGIGVAVNYSDYKVNYGIVKTIPTDWFFSLVATSDVGIIAAAGALGWLFAAKAGRQTNGKLKWMYHHFGLCLLFFAGMILGITFFISLQPSGRTNSAFSQVPPLWYVVIGITLMGLGKLLSYVPTGETDGKASEEPQSDTAVTEGHVNMGDKSPAPQ